MRKVSQFNTDIRKMSNRVIKRVTEAQQEACQKICEDIKRGAPVNTGAYRDSIKVSKTYINQGKISTRIYSTMTLGQRYGGNPTWDSVPLAYIIEHGTKPHFITPREPDGVLRWEDEDGVHFAKWVWHTGTIAVPHWSNAIIRSRDYYARMIRKAIGKGMWR